MKKRSIKSLSLKKTTVSKLDTNTLQGGKEASRTLWHSIIICVTRITNEDCPSLTCPQE
ncbi:hypothetical protein [Kordia sp.]|uniref:hypothetical protein n=1 Tax=Kordia sp. TaxID=1965332 RepID=UPI0025BDAB2F|nr:hypothetical protein [Kordia sp.]MCH2196563.1 hypothetical protein [Kordia sp.]